MLRNFATITALDSGYTVMTSDGRTYAALSPDGLGELIHILAQSEDPAPAGAPVWSPSTDAWPATGGAVPQPMMLAAEQPRILEPDENEPMSTEDLARHNLDILIGAYLEEAIDRDTLMERVGQLCPGIRQEQVSERINELIYLLMPGEPTPEPIKRTPVATAPKKRVRKAKAVKD